MNDSSYLIIMPKGRPPIPTAVRKLAGARPDSLVKNEPKPVTGQMTPPEYLDEIGKTCWNELTLLLKKLGVLSTTDQFAVDFFASTYSRWRQAEDEITTNGLFCESIHGKKYTSPAVGISDKSMKILLNLMSTLGLTPSARSRITVPDDNGDDLLSTFMAKLRK